MLLGNGALFTYLVRFRNEASAQCIPELIPRDFTVYLPAVELRSLHQFAMITFILLFVSWPHKTMLNILNYSALPFHITLLDRHARSRGNTLLVNTAFMYQHTLLAETIPLCVFKLCWALGTDTLHYRHPSATYWRLI